MSGIGSQSFQQSVNVAARPLDELEKPPCMAHQHSGQAVTSIVALRLAKNLDKNQKAGRGVADGVADVNGAVKGQDGNSN